MSVEGFQAAAELQLHRALIKKVEDADKARASCASYKDFVTTWRRLGFMSREAFEKNPGRYWQGVWHHQSVEAIYLEHGWTPAGEYHKRVMDLWSRGFLDGADEIDTFEFRRGNVAGAMHRDTYHDVMHKLYAREEGKPGHRQMPKGGSVAKVGADDTYCAEHNCWFPKSADHSWSWKTSTGTCTAGKAKAGK